MLLESDTNDRYRSYNLSCFSNDETTLVKYLIFSICVCPDDGYCIHHPFNKAKEFYDGTFLDGMMFDFDRADFLVNLVLRPHPRALSCGWIFNVVVIFFQTFEKSDLSFSCNFAKVIIAV
jgi:hypothetical protein